MGIKRDSSLLDAVNEQLARPPKKRSRLEPYFGAHLEFQPKYAEPPPSPESSESSVLSSAGVAEVASRPTKREWPFSGLSDTCVTPSDFLTPRKGSMASQRTIKLVAQLPHKGDPACFSILSGSRKRTSIIGRRKMEHKRQGRCTV